MSPRWAAVAAIVVLATACDRERSARDPASLGRATPGAAGGRYLALGDSFTIGTGSSPAQAFPARLVLRWAKSGCSQTLENVAVNGYTTGDLIERELPALASFRPTFVTLAIGANDIVHGSSLDAYRENVRRILDDVMASGARVVVLPQPDWSRSPAAAVFGTQAALADSIAKFNATLAVEARAKGAEWVDLGPLMQTQATRGQLASDGLHPSADAHDEWAAEIARLLRSPCSR